MPTTMIESDPDTTAPATDTLEDAANYRALHAGSIIGVPLAIIAAMLYAVASTSVQDARQLIPLTLLPIAAAAICFYSAKVIRANQEVYTGHRAAIAGALLAIVSLVGGSAYGGYVFATEVPEGYQRTAFQDLKPTEDDIEAGNPIPNPIQDHIRGQADLFIKGYIRPSSVKFQHGNKEFLLVRDNNECCFGDISKVMFFDQVMVHLKEGLTADLDLRLFRVGGKLSVRQGNPAASEPTLVYSMEADYIK